MELSGVQPPKAAEMVFGYRRRVYITGDYLRFCPVPFGVTLESRARFIMEARGSDCKPASAAQSIGS